MDSHDDRNPHSFQVDALPVDETGVVFDFGRSTLPDLPEWTSRLVATQCASGAVTSSSTSQGSKDALPTFNMWRRHSSPGGKILFEWGGFRLFDLSSIATIPMLLLLGRTTQLGSLKIYGVPSFLFLWAYVGIFLIILRRTPGLRINYRLSPERRRRQMLRRTIPSPAVGFLALGPTAFIPPHLFTVSFGWGIVVLGTDIMVFAGFIMLSPAPRANMSVHCY